MSKVHGESAQCGESGESQQGLGECVESVQCAECVAYVVTVDNGEDRDLYSLKRVCQYKEFTE